MTFTGAKAPLLSCPPHTLPHVRQGVPAPQEEGHQTTQGSPLAKNDGRRGLLMVHMPDPAWVDC